MNYLSVIIVYTKKINERRVIMNIIPGKVTTFPTRTQLYEKGDNVETICYIKSGSITLENNGSSSTAAAGQFIGIFYYNKKEKLIKCDKMFYVAK